jgi:selenocysteine-specific elongation factor
MAIDLILGTAGHIDHGKTALVKALTGVDTDRLPEEKRRGITIDLGFAELDLGPYRLGIVDVPGHERFVRNMLAGATGVDLALLVVAADDSVKPQTREHLEILRLLGLEAGVIALTKCDLPEPGWIDLVEEEVGQLVSGTFLAGAPLVRTSVVTGQGLDDLRRALIAAAERAAGSPRRRQSGPFRMAIDRAFTIAGHGTIVTGSVLSGSVRVGDAAALEPGGVLARVRGLENHGRPAEEVRRGQRAAINLAGVRREEVERGQELATPGHLVPSRLLTVALGLLPAAPRPLKARDRVRIHLGTAEQMASLILLDRSELRPGQRGPAQLFLARPVVATWSQPFVLRAESPVTTIGGGTVLDPNALRLRRPTPEQTALLDDLALPDPLRRASAAIYFMGLRQWEPRDLARAAGIEDCEGVCRTLIDRHEVQEIEISPTRAICVHRLVLDEMAGRVEAALERMHQEAPLAAAIEPARLASRFAYVESDAVLEAVLRAMAAAGRIERSERGIALAGRGPQLSPKERDLVEWIVATYREADFQPPSVTDVRAQAARNQAAVPKLIELAAAQGRLVKVGPDLYLHAEAEARMRRSLGERLAEGQGLTLSQIREILETTRKYAVPLCEYLDRIGFTRRQGDLRVLAKP